MKTRKVIETKIEAFFWGAWSACMLISLGALMYSIHFT